MAGPLPVLFGATTGTAPYAPILKRAWFGFNPPFRQSTSSRVSSTNHSCPSRFWSALHTWIKLELWIMIYKLVGAPIIYFPRWQGGPASIFLGRMWASDWSEKYVKGRWGKAGPTRPIPISTKHLCKFFPVWQRWTYDVVAGARTCTTLVGLSLNFTKKCEYWINLACSYTEILTQVTQVLRVGYLNSNDLMINCIQLALEWRVPLMNLLSVNFLPRDFSS